MVRHMNTGVNRAFLMLSNTVQMSAMGAYEEHKRIFEAIKQQEYGNSNERNDETFEKC